MAPYIIDYIQKNVIPLPVLHIIGGGIMRVTIKGQVTIPQGIREKLGNVHKCVPGDNLAERISMLK